MHDALAHLTTEPINGSGAYLAAKGWRLDNLFMVANVSRVLHRLTVPFYRSSVRCEFAPGDGDAGIRHYASFRHSLDPIAAVRAFTPAGWGSRFMPVSVEHLLEWNVHGLEHHLRHPDVHVPILNRLLDFPSPGNSTAMPWPTCGRWDRTAAWRWWTVSVRSSARRATWSPWPATRWR
jgi:hypothetical protein